MNAFNRVVNIQGELFRYLNILPRPRIRKMTAHKDVEVVSEELVEYLHVLMKIRRAPRLRLRHLCGRRSEEHTSELQSHLNLVCRLLLEIKKIQDMLQLTYR